MCDCIPARSDLCNTQKRQTHNYTYYTRVTCADVSSVAPDNLYSSNCQVRGSSLDESPVNVDFVRRFSLEMERFFRCCLTLETRLHATINIYGISFYFDATVSSNS